MDGIAHCSASNPSMPMYMPSKPNFSMSGRNHSPGLNRTTMSSQGTEAQARPSILPPPKFPLDDRLEHKGGTLGLLVTTVQKGQHTSCKHQANKCACRIGRETPRARS